MCTPLGFPSTVQEDIAVDNWNKQLNSLDLGNHDLLSLVHQLHEKQCIEWYLETAVAGPILILFISSAL
jgi:hypothetical protein